MAEPIDPALAKRLDAFTVPALPEGFADRLMDAVSEMPSPAQAMPGAPLPPLRRPGARRWLRGGIAGLGTLAVGMISISAAAMGYLGEPIRLAVSEAPVIGTVVERVIPKAMRQPQKPATAQLAKPAAPQIEAPASAAPLNEAQPARWLTPMERRARAREIMADPEKRRAWIEAHPVAAQRIMRRAELRRQRAEGRAQLRRQRIEAGIAVPSGLEALPRAMPGPERRERLEYLRQLRRERMEMRRERIETRRRMRQSAVEAPPPEAPLAEAQPPEAQP
jgi:hypothetical protein